MYLNTNTNILICRLLGLLLTQDVTSYAYIAVHEWMSSGKANLQKSFRSSGASKILSGVVDMYLVFFIEAGVIA